MRWALSPPSMRNLVSSQEWKELNCSEILASNCRILILYMGLKNAPSPPSSREPEAHPFFGPASGCSGDLPDAITMPNHSTASSILNCDYTEAGACSQRYVLPPTLKSKELNSAVFQQHLHPNLQGFRAVSTPSTLPQLEAGPDAQTAIRTSRP